MRHTPVPEDLTPSLGGRLRRSLRLVRAALLWERLWPALVPVLSLAACFVALALFDVLPMLPGWLHALVLSGFAGGIAYLGWRGLARVHMPGEDESARRLERESGMAHRPLSALSDRMAAGEDDTLARAMWQLHLRRMAEQAHRLRLGWPSPGMAARDPLGYRFAALLLLVIAAAGGWDDAPGRLGRAVRPDLPVPGSGPVALEVWITPPAYTGLAPVLLRPGQHLAAPLPVPAGSALLAVLAGGWGEASLLVDGASLPFQPQEDGGQRIETRLNSGSTLAVERHWRKLAEWPVAVTRDALPSAAFAEPPAAGERGRLRLAVEVSDDYGVVKAWVAVRRVGAPETGEPLVLPLPPPPAGASQAATVAGWQDLTAHPWAGLPVTLTPAAEDGMGQVGTGEPVPFTLPERTFTNPVAQAIIEKRRQVTEDRGRAAEIVNFLGTLLETPELVGDDDAVVLALALATQVLQNPAFDLDEVQDLLWNSALRIEDGTLADAEHGLDEARQALEQALAGNASAPELERLLEEYEQALARYLDALAQRMEETGEDVALGPDRRMLTGEDLGDLLDGMRGLAETGDRDALRRMLDDLSQMLAGLQAMPAQDGAAARSLDSLRDLSRRQQELLDDSFRRSNTPDQPGKPQAKAESDSAAKAQEALREALEEVTGDLAEALGGETPGGLAGAGEAMDGAASSLSRGAWGEAADQQGEALRQMREAARDAARQMEAQGSGPGQLGMVPRDPLGRPVRGSGFGDNGDTRIPDRSDIQRAREILEELRRRAGEWQRPETERDYLKRLLKQF